MTNQVKFSMPARGLTLISSIIPPKRYTDTSAWFKVSAKRLNEKLRGLNLDRWEILDEIVSSGTIIFKLTNKDGQLASLTIERRGTMSKVR